MPPAEMQRLFGLAVESANLSYSLLRRRREQPSTAMANSLDDALEQHTSSWDSLWIDVGGEG